MASALLRSVLRRRDGSASAQKSSLSFTSRLFSDSLPLMAKSRQGRPTRPQAPPVKEEPRDWIHYELWKRVSDAIRAVPDYFKTTTNLEGILGPDIFTLNSLLGATIEEQIVRTLNELRPVWDPNKQ